jgi:signal transduction histidine kinase
MSSTRILLVEDDPAQARLLREILSEPEESPVEVSHAVRLSEAEQAAATDRFDLVLLDLSLPDSRGVDTIRRMRSVAPRAPVVVLTTLDDEALGLEAVRGGAQDYLVKGQTDRRLLLRSIGYAIQRHRTEQELARYRDGLEDLVAQRTASLAQTNEALQQQVSERMRAERALASALRTLANDRERQRLRLAGEIHDSVGQELIALKFALEHVQASAKSCLEGEPAQDLSDAIEHTMSLIREVRAICHGLYPPTLEAFGLASALKHMVEPFSKAAVVTVRHGPGLESVRLRGDVEIALFRIAQEALQNALRHGRAAHVAIALAYENSQAVLSITDDGTGFDVEKAAGRGLGLVSMRERAMTTGGVLGLSSRPGETRVEVRVPTALLARAKA